MARDATARLYDVDEDTVVFTKLRQSVKYDHGTIKFNAREGRLIDLDKLHESVWASRLSEGTRSGLVQLDVVAAGNVVVEENEVVLHVAGADAVFLLGKHPDEEHQAAFASLREALEQGKRVTTVTGRLDGWTGRWPDFLKQLPPKPRRILVSSFETESS